MRQQRPFTTILSFISKLREPTPKLCHLLLGLCILACLALPNDSAAAPFKDFFKFTQPNNQEITLRGQGDDFDAIFETTSGYTVVFDPEQKAYFYARLSADGKNLVSTGIFAQDPAPEGLKRHLRIDPATAREKARANRDKWDEIMDVSRRWSDLKNQNLGTPQPPGASEPAEAPPPTTTTGSIVGLTLLIDFPDQPATISKSDIDTFLNGTSVSLFGNNGSVYQYFKDVSNSRLSYTNVATIYVRMNNPKSYYNNTAYDCGIMGRLLISDAMAILKARSDYASTILPTFSALSTDSSGYVRGFNVYFAGANSGAWSYGLWPHSWAVSSPIPLGNGKSLYRYQVSDIGTGPRLGTFCHENGHMICGFPDIYDYGYDSSGGAGYFSLMGYGSLFVNNPSQVDAYLKTAAGWASVTDLDSATSLAGTLVAAPGSGYNTFYRYRKPGVLTEYYLFENRQRTQRDTLLPGAGIAVWHVDELGSRDNQSIVPNQYHLNYELSLVQADNKYHLQNYVNAGDSQDLYYLGNTALGYTNRLDDTTAPSGQWWDGSGSKLNVSSFGASGALMTLDFKASAAYSVCGTVRSGSATGTPVAGATVSIGGKTAVTSSTGTFCITGLAAGTYTLTIVKTGYATFTKTAFAVNGDINNATFIINLQTTYYLSGTVRSGSSTGPVLPGATVSLAGRSAVSDSYGAFNVTGIPAGTYTVTVSKSGYNTLTVPNYTVTGNRSGVVYYLTATATYYLSGTVHSGSSTGPVLSGATVAIAGRSAVTNSYGAFTVTGIPAGTYTVTVSKNGYNSLTVPNYTVTGNRSGVVYYLIPYPTYSLSGTVRSGSSTGPVLPGATLSIAGKTTTTSSTGAFLISGLLEGTYTLTIAKTGYYTKTIVGTVTGNRTGLVYYLTPLPTYYLSGTVRSGSSTGPVLSGATVAIAGKSAVTSSYGTFTITGVPAGTYTVTVAKSGYNTLTVPNYTVTGNRSGVVYYLTVAPTYYLSGTVRSGSSTGPVLSGATVAIAGRSAVTNSYGAFTVTGIRAGTYTVTVSKSGYKTLTVPNYTVTGNRSGVVYYLTVAPTYYVSGTVRAGSSTGPVLAGATVSIAGKSVLTSSTGTFTITGILAGTYTATITKSGYYPRTVTGFTVTGNRTGVIFYLSPSGSAAASQGLWETLQASAFPK